MRAPFLAAALVFAVILSGPLLSDTQLQSGVTLAQETTNSPSDCPGRLAGLPYRIGRGIAYEAPDRMDLLCQYRKKNIRSGDPSVSISLFYYAPSAEPKHIGGFCWKVRGQPDPEIVTKSPPGGSLQPGGEHFIRLSYSAPNHKPKKVRAAAVALAEDLIDQGRVLACLGADGEAADTGGPDPAFDAAVEAFIAAADAFTEREAGIDALDEHADSQMENSQDAEDEGDSDIADLIFADAFGLDAQARAEESASHQLYAADLAKVSFAPEEQMLIDELIERNKELAELLLEANSWSQFVADNPSNLDAVLEATESEQTALTAAISAARDAERAAYDEVADALGLVEDASEVEEAMEGAVPEEASAD